MSFSYFSQTLGCFLQIITVYQFSLQLLVLSVSVQPHTGSLGPMAGGFGGSNMQKAQSLIDLGSSRYESLVYNGCILYSNSTPPKKHKALMFLRYYSLIMACQI